MSEMASSRGASGIGEIEYLQGCLWDGAALRAFGGNSR